jgi:hypothetical protein
VKPPGTEIEGRPVWLVGEVSRAATWVIGTSTVWPVR